jgi:hypothetical protein
MRIHTSFALAVLLSATAITTSATATTAPALRVALWGSDANPCTQVAPCKTFNRAYRAAAPGDTVEIAAGSYPAQTITPDPAKTTATSRVIFRPAPNANVQVVGVTVTGSHLELRDMVAVWAVQARPTSAPRDVVIRNVTSPGAVYISGARAVSILGGQIYSPRPVASDSQISSVYGNVPTNILIDGVSFHDFVDVGPGQYHHIECLQIGAGINLTIRNSRFRNCATHDIFIRSWGTANGNQHPLTNVALENNLLEPVLGGYYDFQFMDDLWTGVPAASLLFRNNTVVGGNALFRLSHGTASVRNNILPSASAYWCGAYGQIRWLDYNLWQKGTACGPHDRVGTAAFVDAAHGDYHLTDASRAIDAGDPGSFAPFDMDGKARPVGCAPDAGAYEFP